MSTYSLVYCYSKVAFCINTRTKVCHKKLVLYVILIIYIHIEKVFLFLWYTNNTLLMLVVFLLSTQYLFEITILPRMSTTEELEYGRTAVTVTTSHVYCPMSVHLRPSIVMLNVKLEPRFSNATST